MFKFIIFAGLVILLSIANANSSNEINNWQVGKEKKVRSLNEFIRSTNITIYFQERKQTILSSGLAKGNLLTRILYKAEPRTSYSNRSSILQRKKRGLKFNMPGRMSGLVSGNLLNIFISMCRASERPCPTWTEWTGYDVCSVSCGGGNRILRRYCQHEKATKRCIGNDTRYEDCNMHRCPTWSAWSSVSACSASCGQGQMIVSRSCVLDARLTRGCDGVGRNIIPCVIEHHCPPEWSSWSSYSRCSQTCGMDGSQERSRKCIGHNFNERPCIGESTQTRSCVDNVRCPPHEVNYTAWSSWSNCDVTCGMWSQAERRRNCLSQNCNEELLFETKICRPSGCDVTNMTMSEEGSADAAASQPYSGYDWSEWTRCSTTCGSGIQLRSRQCHVTYNATQTSCHEASTESRTCHHAVSCPTWDNWSTWRQCSGICGGSGMHTRHRYCVIKRYSSLERLNGALDKHEDPTAARKETTESSYNAQHSITVTSLDRTPVHDFIQTTSEQVREEVNAIESRGNRNERIITLSPGVSDILFPTTSAPQFKSYFEEVIDYELCEGGYDLSYEEETCITEPCVSFWNTWSSWSPCSSSCGVGYAASQRTCNTSINEDHCRGNSIKYQRCYSPPCWTGWSSYSPCTTSCGSTGTKIRSRRCVGKTNYITFYAQCVGNVTEITSCNTQECPRWGSWSEYSSCSVSCGGGIQYKTRQCERGICEGRNVHESGCNYQPCPVWTEWSGYTCCSVTCGEGVKNRTRRCRYGQPGDEGCIGETHSIAWCDAGTCNITLVAFDSFQCGVRSRVPIAKATNPSHLRIHGGRISHAHHWPWQVSLQYHDCRFGSSCWSHFCGGTLIAPQWVVTAGHCTEELRTRIRHDDPGDGWSVVVGMHDMNARNEENRIRLRRVFVHPEYLYHGVVINDIELIKLDRPAVLAASIMPACLPQRSAPADGENCYITGWGHTEERAEITNQLREAAIPVMSFNKCQNLGNYYQYYLSERYHMCAGDPKTARTDSCEGDSGGPLVCVRQDGRWYLAGITSFAFSRCGTPNHVGIYAPVNAYEEWIRNTIEMNSHGGC